MDRGGRVCGGVSWCGMLTDGVDVVVVRFEFVWIVCAWWWRVVTAWCGPLTRRLCLLQGLLFGDQLCTQPFGDRHVEVVAAQVRIT